MSVDHRTRLRMIPLRPHSTTRRKLTRPIHAPMARQACARSAMAGTGIPLGPTGCMERECFPRRASTARSSQRCLSEGRVSQIQAPRDHCQDIQSPLPSKVLSFQYDGLADKRCVAASASGVKPWTEGLPSWSRFSMHRVRQSRVRTCSGHDFASPRMPPESSKRIISWSCE